MDADLDKARGTERVLAIENATLSLPALRPRGLPLLLLGTFLLLLLVMRWLFRFAGGRGAGVVRWGIGGRRTGPLDLAMMYIVQFTQSAFETV